MSLRQRSGDGAGRLIWVRHGESEGNRDRRFTHSTEVPLTDNGRAQARNAAERIHAQFAPIRVVASPYARARETGEIIAAELALPLSIDPEVREQHMGQLMGQPYDVALQDPAFNPQRRWEWRPPGGEALTDVQRRVVPALLRLASVYPAQDVVVVAHAGVLMAIEAHITGCWEQVLATANAGIIVVEHHGGVFSTRPLIE
ncbi:MAG: histidine phosphatase family protein [Deltaproteobacteria bacterium]|nr:histidine phosphatase family protein [Deltaproteobacteria bacterium]